ncbi:lamin tail domain-containing protein [Streptomyces sp. NRRL S-1448]|uniref:lamin tail domain-containing protein n=1 Tax=Streptomyces sp. NRRL S-1448 TaxID=1463883 RepID=UPI0004C1F9D3|nr:lamin tail domain-containing protein [Streptomyces sp. NRRL S-1448]
MFRHASRVAVAVAGAAALAATAALPAAAADHHRGHHAPGWHHRVRSAVVLGPIQYDSPGRDDHSNRSLNAEWVTLRNTGRWPVTIKGWTLSDKTGHSYRFGNVRLAGHSQVRVHTGIGRDNRTDLFQDRRDYFWDNYSDTATLRNDHRRIVDSRSWGHHWGHHGHWGHGHWGHH